MFLTSRGFYAAKTLSKMPLPLFIFRDELMDKIIQICSQNDFQHISNFEWYITVLVELSRTEGGTKHGKFLLIWGESTLAKTEILWCEGTFWVHYFSVIHAVWFNATPAVISGWNQPILTRFSKSDFLVHENRNVQLPMYYDFKSFFYFIGKLLAKQMMDVAIRVSSIRSFAVSQMALLVENHTVLLGNSSTVCF